MIERIDELRAEAEGAIAAADSTAALEELRVRYLGRKAELPNLLRGVAQLPPEERGTVGQAANQARQALEALIEARAGELEAGELDVRLAADRVDVTLPGEPPQPVGRLHLLTATWRELEDVFVGLGFTVVEGPEVETVHYNFDALNHSPTHPARDRSDTFYVADDVVLRTHTSPMQIRAMEAHPPPLYVVIPGRVYRRDQSTRRTRRCSTRSRAWPSTRTSRWPTSRARCWPSRARSSATTARCACARTSSPSPSRRSRSTSRAFSCAGKGYLPDGSRCSICRGEGWIEILGAGEVDPNVYGYVDDDRYDPEKVQGFAWGMGIERIAMLKHGVTDLRLFFENDLRFLEQFG